MKTWCSIFLLTLLVLGVGCKKQKSTTYYVDNEIKEWVLFQKDSYWIYVNEKTQKQDSAYIKMIPREAVSLPWQESADCFEAYYYEVTNSFFLDVGIQRDYDQSVAKLTSFFPTEGPFPGLTSIILTNPLIDTTKNPALIQIIDTMVINNNIFTNVLHTRNTSNYYNHLQNDYYFAKNIGLVRYSIKTNSFDSTWSLMRYHVIQ
jgi:hypothetical protein